MIKILTITSVLPVPLIESKKEENDILLITEDQIIKRKPEISFHYIFIFPFANKLLSLVSKKWKEYYTLKQKMNLSLRGRTIFLLPICIIPIRFLLQNILYHISLFSARKRLEIIIEKVKPTVIHAQDAGVSAFVAKKLSKEYHIPYIVTLRGIQEKLSNTLTENINSADSIIAVSQQQLKNGKKLTDRPIKCIPHGVDESFYKTEFTKSKKDESLKLIMVSRLLAIKNTAMVISSLSQVKEDFVFDLYGTGPEEQSLRKLVKKLCLEDKVNFKGRVAYNKMPSVYSKYDLFIMPSYPEGLGRVYFEAMASGLPVIASKNTGIDGFICHGKEGYLLNPLVEEEFKIEFLNIMETLYNNRLELDRLKTNAINFSKDFTWDKIVSQYYEIYAQYNQ